MPPSLRDWLPADHLAWFVIESVERLDLEAFYAAYRPDGHGRAAYEPSMIGLVLYAYSTNVRSSRAIERHCRQDIAYRVITGNRVPDHATIARFIVRHEGRLAELFTSVLRLCAKAGLVSSGVVAVDGTKLSASANSDANVDYDRVAREIIAEAIATDEAEDEQHGDARGDELPPELSTEAARREWLTRVLDEERSAEGELDEEGPAGLDRRPYSFMRRVLASDLGKELYRKRQQSIEPVFGHTKHNRGFSRFHRRGRLAVRTEWRLITMSHNLTKLHRHQLVTVRA